MFISRIVSQPEYPMTDGQPRGLSSEKDAFMKSYETNKELTNFLISHEEIPCSFDNEITHLDQPRWCSWKQKRNNFSVNENMS